MKKTVTLHRKLPAAVHLKDGTISVRVASRDPKNQAAAATMVDTMTTELLKYNNQFKIDDNKPDTLVFCNITELLTPGTKIVARSEATPVQVGNKWTTQQQTHQYQEVTGSISVAYSVKDNHTSKILNADNLVAKFNQEFDAGGNKTGKGLKLSNPLKSNPFSKKKPDEEEKEDETAPTPAQLQQILVRRIVKQVAARLTNTDEMVEIRLARGPSLDQYNDFAEKGLWNRMLEPLETMTPLDPKAADAFRQYNIGVAYEALAYQAEEPKAARKYLDEAAVNYGKAVDANSHEKEFLDAQNRIATAQAHYATLANTQTASKPASKEPNQVASAGSTTGKDAKSDALTNAEVIELAKQGLDEDNLVATINEAPKVNFDLSASGTMELLKGGVKGKVLTAMRNKAHAGTTRRTTAKPAAQQ